jgi:hypothetical protein
MVLKVKLAICYTFQESTRVQLGRVFHPPVLQSFLNDAALKRKDGCHHPPLNIFIWFLKELDSTYFL